jgi:hypothetical protein
MSRRGWWLCPNGECDHGNIFHDIEDFEDRRPTCCVEGCPCGHGNAVRSLARYREARRR